VEGGVGDEELHSEDEERDGPLFGEVTFNLWYIYDSRGFIRRLRARAYAAIGSEAEIFEMLDDYAQRDYIISRPFPIPARFHCTSRSEEGDEETVPFALREAQDNGWYGGPLELFQDALTEIAKDVPLTTSWDVPVNPIVCITPVLIDEQGAAEHQESRIMRVATGWDRSCFVARTGL
jgi:hypothetical protein